MDGHFLLSSLVGDGISYLPFLVSSPADDLDVETLISLPWSTSGEDLPLSTLGLQIYNGLLFAAVTRVPWYNLSTSESMPNQTGVLIVDVSLSTSSSSTTLSATYLDLTGTPLNSQAPGIWVANDVTAGDGKVYISDSLQPAVHVVTLGDTPSEASYTGIITNDGLTGVVDDLNPTAVGANGIEFIDEDTLLVNVFGNAANAGLFRVSLKDNVVTKLDLPDGTNVQQADGMYLSHVDERVLYMCAVTSIKRIISYDGFKTIAAVETYDPIGPLEGSDNNCEPTTGFELGGSFYYVCSQAFSNTDEHRIVKASFGVAEKPLSESTITMITTASTNEMSSSEIAAWTLTSLFIVTAFVLSLVVSAKCSWCADVRYKRFNNVDELKSETELTTIESDNRSI